MEVRANCAFHIITKITQTRMKDFCQGQRGKVLTPGIRTSQENAGAGAQGTVLRVEDLPLVLCQQGVTEVKTHLRTVDSMVLLLLLYTKDENDRLYKAIFIPVTDAVPQVLFWLKHTQEKQQQNFSYHLG